MRTRFVPEALVMDVPERGRDMAMSELSIVRKRCPDIRIRNGMHVKPFGIGGRLFRPADRMKAVYIDTGIILGRKI